MGLRRLPAPHWHSSRPTSSTTTATNLPRCISYPASDGQHGLVSPPASRPGLLQRPALVASKGSWPADSGSSSMSVPAWRVLVPRPLRRQLASAQRSRRRWLHLAPPFLLDDYVPRYQTLSARDEARKRSLAYAHLRNCNLCPRQCGVNRFETTGMCLIGEKVKVNVIAPHFGEGSCCPPALWLFVHSYSSGLASRTVRLCFPCPLRPHIAALNSSTVPDAPSPLQPFSSYQCR